MFWIDVCHIIRCLYRGGGVTGGYVFPHFRNFFALFPQIRTQRLTISAFRWACEQGPPASISNTAQSTKTIFFVFCICADYMQTVLLSSRVFFLRENFVLIVVVVALVFRSS